MNRIVAALTCGVVLVAGAAIPSAARAANDATVQQALGLVQQNRPAEAYALLDPQVPHRAGDPDFDYALGLAAIDSGHPAAAILAFQRVLSVNPGNAPARAELARAYAAAGDIDTAKREFDTVVDDPSVPDPVRRRFNRITRDLGDEQRGGRPTVFGFAEASIGYDSNINSATAADSITLPLFAGLGPAKLSGNARERDSGYYGLDGGVSIIGGIARQTRAFASVLGSWRDNFSGSTFDQATATGTAGLAHTLATRDVVSASAQFQQFWLGGDRYRQAYGPTVQYTHRLQDGAALSGTAQWYRLDYQTDPLRDADRYALAATYTNRLLFLTIGGGKEETRRAAGDANSNWFFSARGGIEYPVQERLSLFAAAGIERRDYDRADVLFLKERADTQLDGSVGVKVKLTDRLYLRPAVTYTRNFSNIDLYDYDRVTASIAVRAEY